MHNDLGDTLRDGEDDRKQDVEFACDRPNSSLPDGIGQDTTENHHKSHFGEFVGESRSSHNVRNGKQRGTSRGADNDDASWYKDPAHLLTFIAISVSVVFSALSLWVSLKSAADEETKAKLETLRQTVVAIIDVRAEAHQMMQNPSQNVIALRDASANLNSKKTMLMETAEALLEELGSSVGPHVFLALGYDMQMDARFREAYQMYDEALKKAKEMQGGGHAAAVANQMLAQLSMIPGSSTYSLVEGRSNFKSSVDAFRLKTDEYSKYLRVEGYVNWAVMERINGHPTLADSLFHQADAIAVNMHPENPQKAQALLLIQQHKRGYIPARDVGDPAGNWTVTFDGTSSLLGKASITYVPQMNSYSVSVFIEYAGEVSEIRRGSAVRTASGLLQVTWDGNRHVNGYPVVIPGITELEFEGGTMVGKDYIAGIEPIGVVYTPTAGSTTALLSIATRTTGAD